MPAIPQYYRMPVIRNVTLCLVRLFENVKMVTQESKMVDNSKPFLNYIDENLVPREKIIPVPIHIGFYDKFYAMEKTRERYERTGEKNLPPVYRPLPSLCLVMDSVSYDGERHKSADVPRIFYEPDTNNAVFDPVVDSYFADKSPVPYNLGFSLEFQCRSFDQIGQFLEQVVPYFGPHRSIRVKEFNFLNIERDYKVVLTGTSTDLMKDVGMNEDKRTYSVTLTLEVQAFFYLPLYPVGIIKKINSTYLLREQDERNLRNTYEAFTRKFLAPVTVYDEINGIFVVQKDVDGNVVYETMPETDVPSLLEVFDEMPISNYDVFAFSASGTSGTIETTVKPYQLFAGSGFTEVGI